MKGWWLPIGVTLGLATVAAVLVWRLLPGPTAERWQAEGPGASGGTAPPSPGIPLTAETGPRPTIREGSPQTAGPVPVPSSLEPLFTALAINRPVEPPEAPDFTLPDLEGRPVRLREFRGKLVFVNFWATWCPPCRLEMPSMERLYQTFKPTAFAMLAVSIDRQGVQAVKPFMEELQLTFPALLDSKTEIARQYGLRGLPTTYLIDRNGWLIGAAVGGRDWSSTEAKALIAGLLRHNLATASDPDQGQPREGR
jgi:peroxiredoxin